LELTTLGNQKLLADQSLNQIDNRRVSMNKIKIKNLNGEKAASRLQNRTCCLYWRFDTLSIKLLYSNFYVPLLLHRQPIFHVLIKVPSRLKYWETPILPYSSN
jgi:hypothetical protein